MTETGVVPVPAQREDVLESAVRAFSRAWVAMSVACPGGWAGETDGVLRVATGLPVAPFNGVWCVGRDVPVAPVLDAVDEFLAGDLPWNVQLRPGCPAALDEELAARGLVPTDTVPFMIASGPASADTALATAAPVVRRASSFADADAVLRLLEQGFGMPAQLTRELLPLALLFAPMARTWLASVDAVDVSTALELIVDGTAGIYNVATPEEHRGRGYGTAATAQAVVDAFAAGADCVYLQSSFLGRSVYEKLGFATRESWQQWMPAQYVTDE